MKTEYKVTYKRLAEYLGVSISAISNYNKKKRLLMLIGLKRLNEIREKETN